MRYHLREKGKFLEILEIDGNNVIAICSSDPNSPNYQRKILEKITPLDIFNAAQGVYAVSSETGSFFPDPIVQEFSATKAVLQTGHGLTAPSALYFDVDGKFKASIPADLNKHGFMLLVSTQGDNLFIAAFNGLYRITLPIGNNDPNSPVYIGADGKLTLTEPTVGENKMTMGWMVGENQIYYNPVFEHEPVVFLP